MVERVQLPIPMGDLLPAEERLENAVEAILDRIKVEVEIRDGGFNDDGGDPYLEGLRRGFVNGLDIAWSLAQTEKLRRTDSPK